MTDEGDLQRSEVLLYQTPSGGVRGEVFLESESFWLSRKKMSDLFGVGVQTINHHLRERS